MKNNKLKPVWYGKKTFEIIKGFNYQGVAFYAKNLFTCNKETYEDYKEYLGNEYIVRSKEEIKKEKEAEEENEKEEADKKADEKQSQENASSENKEVKIDGYKIKNEEELKKLSDAGMTEKDINRDDKKGMYIKPDSKFFPKKRGIFNKIFKK